MKKAIQMLTLILAVLFCVYAAAEEDPLFIAQEGGKQGFINKAGEWVIQPEYTRVWPFTDAGYAAVETEKPPLISSFRLIDRQGNVLADLPDWQLDTYETDLYMERQNAVSNAFVLLTKEPGDYRYALYFADTGAMIELDEAFLGKAEAFGYGLMEDGDNLVLCFICREFPYDHGYIIMDRQGKKLHEGYYSGEPDGMKFDHEYYGYYIEGSDHIPSKFMYGWECFSDETGYSYINSDWEKMYGRIVFDKAEPFSNGLARVKIMDETYALLDAYINTDGRIVWAENGRKDEVQRWLDEGVRHTVKDMTLEDARQFLVGEWEEFGGSEYFAGMPIIFCEDGTGCIGNQKILHWNVQMFPETIWKKRMAEREEEADVPFMLDIQYVENDEADKDEDGCGWELYFRNRDQFSIGYYGQMNDFIRVAPGYWDKYGKGL